MWHNIFLCTGEFLDVYVNEKKAGFYNFLHCLYIFLRHCYYFIFISFKSSYANPMSYIFYSVVLPSFYKCETKMLRPLLSFISFCCPRDGVRMAPFGLCPCINNSLISSTMRMTKSIRKDTLRHWIISTLIVFALAI